MTLTRRQTAALTFMLLVAAAQVTHAQSTPPTNTEALPMRNVQIEVRQVRDSSQAINAAGAQGNVTLQPGNSGASVNITAQNSQRSDGRNLLQQVLVLNGRNVAINLGNTVPLRLVQTFVQNGVVRYVGGTVLVDANSGFAARPVWRGGDSAELELAAVQASRPGMGANLPQGAVNSSSASTVLALPLGQWVTVAQSDDALAGSSSGFGGAAQSSGREALRVEVRLSVR